MPTPPTDIHLTQARAIARVLDSAIAIPGTRFRVGLDPILGLVPGVGDLISAAMSGYIVLVGIRAGASRATIARMIANVAIDTVVGSVPVIGDLFDAGWKSNRKNLELIELGTIGQTTARVANRWFLIGVALALVLIAAAGVTLAVLLVRAVLGLF